MERTTDPSRDLLFGLLALQNGLIDQSQLVAAFHAWTRDKARPLAEHLVTLGHLKPEHRPLLEGLAAAHVARHGGDVEKSLVALSAGRSTCESLARIDDPDIGATLAQVGSASNQQDTDGDPDRTASYAVGSATSDGQRFRVLRPHAKGGLGAVFVALDGELHREVALKQILDHHADDPTSRQRFLLEAEITGGLEHPGIVPVYGLGTYADGRPYYAMRFIRGDSLKEAIERFHADEALNRDPGQRSLELRQLLRRFLDVCNAIDYAHSRGVLHRDIKPGNIIIGKHGETLVVDWGLAKATGKSDPAAGERTLMPSSSSGSAETLPGSALGTPAYMSPEQAAGHLEHLGPRSDVYNLGATLYCLLTGRPPFEGDIADVLRGVQNGQFPPPRQVDPLIDRALEAVCLKAMALRAVDRYATPRALAEDLERWMADEPVAAWREPWWIRARRHLVRHRSLLGALAIAIPVALVCLSSVAVLERLTRQQIEDNNRTLTRAQSDTQAALARAQKREDLALKAVDNYRRVVEENPDLAARPELAPLRGRLMDLPNEFYRHLRAELQSEAKEGRPVQVDMLARANFALAWIAAQIGSEAEAMRSYREAIDIMEPLATKSEAKPNDRSVLAMALNNYGNLQVNAGRLDEALATHRRAFEIRTELVGRDPHSSHRGNLSLSHHNLGWVESRLDRVDSALDHYRKARDLREALVREAGNSQNYRVELGQTCVNLGWMLVQVGRLSEARESLGRAIELLEGLARDNPNIASYRSELAQAHANFGALEQASEILQDAGPGRTHFERALALRDALVREVPSIPEYRTALAQSCLDLGNVERNVKQFARGEPLIRRAVEVMEGLLREHPGSVPYRTGLVKALNHLGLLQVDDARPAEALAPYGQALALLETLERDNPSEPGLVSLIAGTHNNRGMALAKLGQHEEARADYLVAIKRERACLDQAPRVLQYRLWLTNHYRNLSKALRALGRTAEAHALALEWIALWDGYDRPGERYNFACDLALDAAAVGRGKAELTAAERAQRNDYADRAMLELRRAIEGGFRDVKLITHDPDFDFLRSRADFHELMTDLIVSVDPFAP